MVQRSWLYVLVAFMMSSFFGGALRVFFSPDRVRQFVEGVVTDKQPKFHIDFEGARLRFENHWMPTFAVELRGIQIQAKDPCITNSTLYLDQILIPLDLLALFKNQVKFGQVEAGAVRYFHRPSTCSQEQAPRESNDGFAPFENFFQKRWSKEVVNTTKLLKVFTVSQFEVLYDNENLAPMIIEDFEMSFWPDRGESRASFYVRMGEPWVGTAPIGRIAIDTRIASDEVEVIGRGNLKEGQLQLKGNWAVDRGDVQLHLAAQDLPLMGALDLAHHWKYFSSLNPKIKNQWATCDVTMAGPLRNFALLPVQMHQCRLYGDLGDIRLKTQKIGSLSEGGVLQFEIQNVGVQRFMRAFGLEGTWGHISSFGSFTGALTVLNRDAYQLEGDWRDFGVYLAKAYGQIKQNIDVFHLSANFGPFGFRGIGNQFMINGQDVKGELEYSFSSVREGEFGFSFSQLNLPDEAQKILFVGHTPAFDFAGKGQILNSELDTFSAKLNLSELRTLNWKLKDVILNTKYADTLWSAQVNVGLFSLTPESYWSKPIRTLFSGLKLKNADNQLMSISFDLRPGEHEREWAWAQLRAAVKDSKVIFLSDGQMGKNGSLSGEIRSQTSPENIRVWLLGGTMQKPQVTEKAER